MFAKTLIFWFCIGVFVFLWAFARFKNECRTPVFSFSKMRRIFVLFLFRYAVLRKYVILL